MTAAPEGVGTGALLTHFPQQVPERVRCVGCALTAASHSIRKKRTRAIRRGLGTVGGAGLQGR